MTARIEIPSHLSPLLALFASHGEAAYPVGGCVRDTLLGTPPHDWDVAVTSVPELTRRICEEAGLRVVPTGIKHGTVTVLLPTSGDLTDREGAYDPIECTTCRTEGSYTDGRHPDAVAFTGRITDDLSRRDFTVNAMALVQDEAGSLSVLDLFGGQADLDAGIIRCVGDPTTRFSEDALRMLRAVRFAVKLGFAIHPDTEAAIRALAPSLARISRERVSEELAKTLCSPDPAEGVALLRRTALLPFVLPEGADGVRNLPAERFAALPCELIPRLAAMLFALPADAREKNLACLRLPTATRRAVTAICEATDLPTEPAPYTARLWRHRLGDLATTALAVRSACEADEMTARDLASLIPAVEESLARGEATTVAELAINGHDLLALGHREGRALQETLRALLAQVLEDPAKNDKNTLIALARRGEN